MNIDFEFIYRDFLAGREEIAKSEDSGENLKPVVELSAKLAHTRRYLETLKEAINGQELTISDEINLFKHYKPKIYQWLIYDTELANIRWGASNLDQGKLQDYQEEQIEYLSATLRRNNFFYQYYKSGSSELDHLYFVRGAIRDSVLFPVLPDADREFSAPGDYLFARFMATELLLSELKKTDTAPLFIRPVSKKGKPLDFTGPACNLVEIAYGLYLTSQINGGQADLQDIIDVLETVFNVSLAHHSRTFIDFKRRKAVPTTKFLCEMQAQINQKVDDANAYIPPAFNRSKS